MDMYVHLIQDPVKAKQFLPFLQRAGKTVALVEVCTCMYVCVHMYVCIVYMYTCMYMYMYSQRTMCGTIFSTFVEP